MKKQKLITSIFIGALVYIVFIVVFLYLASKCINLLTSIQTVANLSFIVVIAGLIYQLWQYTATTARREKHDFICLTERYTDIQKIFLEHPELSTLHNEILKRDMDNRDKESDYEKLYKAASIKEIGLCSIMFQLMEDVYIIEELKADEEREELAGWNNLFKDWVDSDRVWAIWSKLQNHYGEKFRYYVGRLHKSAF